MSAGYIYILENPALPDVVKIGKTHRDLNYRIKELSSSTSIPLHFKIIYQRYVNDCDTLEREIFTKLKDYRIDSKKEFFKINSDSAIENIDEIISLAIKENEFIVFSNYSIENKEFSDEESLFNFFNSSFENWQLGITDLKSGRIEKWLEKNNSYDKLNIIKKSKSNNYDLLLTKLYLNYTDVSRHYGYYKVIGFLIYGFYNEVFEKHFFNIR